MDGWVDGWLFLSRTSLVQRCLKTKVASTKRVPFHPVKPPDPKEYALNTIILKINSKMYIS